MLTLCSITSLKLLSPNQLISITFHHSQIKLAFLAFCLSLPHTHTQTHIFFFVIPWGRVDTGSQPVGRKPRTSEEVHLPVQWRHSSPEPAAAASAPLVGCPWTASALPGSIDTGQCQQLNTILSFDATYASVHISQFGIFALACVGCRPLKRVVHVFLTVRQEWMKTVL